jgi:hypothetical protein
MVTISKIGVLSIKNILEIIVEINGKDSPKPTPAPQSIAPINRVSNTISKILFFVLKIPENVSLDLEFIVYDRAKAIAGRQ